MVFEGTTIIPLIAIGFGFGAGGGSGKGTGAKTEGGEGTGGGTGGGAGVKPVAVIIIEPGGSSGKPGTGSVEPTENCKPMNRAVIKTATTSMANIPHKRAFHSD